MGPVTKNVSGVIFILLMLRTGIVAGCDSGENRDGKENDAGADGATGQDSGSMDADVDGDMDADMDADSDSGYDETSIPETCEQAASLHTSVGCAFFAVDMDNFDLQDGYPFSVVVSNPQEDQDVNIRIEDMRGDNGTLRTVPGLEVTLAPGELKVFDITCTENCPVKDTSINPLAEKTHIQESGFLARGAFRIVSDVPIIAYQWNTYGKQMATSDTSLLLPVTTLDDKYIAATWPWGHEDGVETEGFDRGEVTIVAVEDGTEVTFTPSFGVEAGPDNIPKAAAAGTASGPYSMNAFDVLQIYPNKLHADLTGTKIEANKPMAVFGGHPCANAPSQPWFSCDHVEEQILPLKAWGEDAVLARYPPRPNVTSDEDPAVWRIVAGTDGMNVTFDPPVEGVGDTYYFSTAGQVLEFQSPINHYAKGTVDNPIDPEKPGAPFFAYQIMTGRLYVANNATVLDYTWGDPFMCLAPPAGQYLNRYVFTTDNIYDFGYDFVTITRKAGVPVTLDCLGPLPDEDFQQVGSTSWEVGHFMIDSPAGVDGCEDGMHKVESAASFGLTVVGLDYALSVGYPGGIGVSWINPVEVE